MTTFREKTAVEDIGNDRILYAPSELTVYTAHDLRSCSVDAVNDGRYHLVVDLSATTDIDSTGLGVLVGMRRRALTYGGSLCLVGPLSERMVRALKISGLTKLFVIVDSMDAVLAVPEED